MSKISTSNISNTDWERLDATLDERIDFSDIPELTPEMFAKAIVKRGQSSKRNTSEVRLQIDQDVLDWFKSQQRDYRTHINALLRAYMESNATPHKISEK